MVEPPDPVAPVSDLAESLPALLDAAPDAMVIVGGDGRIRLANRQVRVVFGYDAAELVGRNVEVLIPERYRGHHQHFRADYGAEPRTRPMGTGRDLWARRKNGSEFPAEISLGPIVTPRGLLVTAAIRDLTDRLRLEAEKREARRAIEIADALRTNLRERETLLQEVHHRVKNNLQVISSLISIQRRSVADPVARAALTECQTRVQAIGLVHEQLYRFADYARVPFSDYVRTLVATVTQAIGASNVEVSLDISVGQLPVDKAIPCGLIVNELLTNAFKHAFPDGRPGRVAIALHRCSDGPLELTVTDDGVGLPDAPATISLGLHLVETLVAQLGGTFSSTPGPGARHLVRFAVEIDP